MSIAISQLIPPAQDGNGGWTSPPRPRGTPRENQSQSEQRLGPTFREAHSPEEVALRQLRRPKTKTIRPRMSIISDTETFTVCTGDSPGAAETGTELQPTPRAGPGVPSLPATSARRFRGLEPRAHTNPGLSKCPFFPQNPVPGVSVPVGPWGTPLPRFVPQLPDARAVGSLQPSCFLPSPQRHPDQKWRAPHASLHLPVVTILAPLTTLFEHFPTKFFPPFLTFCCCC